MKRIFIYGTLLIVIAAALYFTGCETIGPIIEGNRQVVTETRSVPSFEGVKNTGIFDVYIIQADSHEVVMEAESNMLPYVRTSVSGDVLYVETKDNLKPHYPIKVFIYTPMVDEVKLSGSGLIYSDTLYVNDLDVKISGSGTIDMEVLGDNVNFEISGSGSAWIYVEADRLGASISGSGDMYLSGFAYRSNLSISGSGSVHSYGLPVEECYTDISGSGDMYVNVSDYLDVKISGSGSVYYLGNPIVNTNISGSGSVIHP